MASTRNINTRGNYCLQQRQYQESEKHLLYQNSAGGFAYDTRLPGDGLLPGQIPNSKLSQNSINIESFLFGINSTNLVNPQPILVPELNNLQSANIYNKEKTLMPEPLIVDKYKRPFPCP